MGSALIAGHEPAVKGDPGVGREGGITGGAPPGTGDAAQGPAVCGFTPHMRVSGENPASTVRLPICSARSVT